MRQRLPALRNGVTHKFEVWAAEPYGKVKGFVTLNFFDDGTPGEIFVQMDKVDTALRGIARCWALAVSMLFQCREIPAADVLSKFAYMRFEPAGMTGNEKIQSCHSIVDYLARWAMGEIEKRKEKKHV